LKNPNFLDLEDLLKIVGLKDKDAKRKQVPEDIVKKKEQNPKTKLLLNF
jgi:hypothetical protein